MSEDSRIWDPWSSKAKVKHIQMSKLGHFTKSAKKGFIQRKWIQGPVNKISEQLAPNKMFTPWQFFISLSYIDPRLL